MFAEIAERAKKIDVQKLALEIVKLNSGLIKTRLQEQLTVGENGESRDIGKYKSNRYSRLKRAIGSQAPFGIVDLKYTGLLYEKITVKVSDKEVISDSLVPYSKYQIQRYGKSIYDIQDENSKDIAFKNNAAFVEAYNKLLGL